MRWDIPTQELHSVHCRATTAWEAALSRGSMAELPVPPALFASPRLLDPRGWGGVICLSRSLGALSMAVPFCKERQRQHTGTGQPQEGMEGMWSSTCAPTLPGMPPQHSEGSETSIITAGRRRARMSQEKIRDLHPQCGPRGCTRTLPALHWEQSRTQQDGALRGAPVFPPTFCKSCCFLKVTLLILILLAVVRLPIYVNAAFCSPASGLSAINIFKQSHKTAALPADHVLLLHAGRRLLVPPASSQCGAGSRLCTDHQRFCSLLWAHTGCPAVLRKVANCSTAVLLNDLAASSMLPTPAASSHPSPACSMLTSNRTIIIPKLY